MALRPLALQKDINRERIVNLQKKINYIQVTKKKWILLVLFILLVAGWFKFFYKTWTNESVPENADCIIALDVKKITNTLIWNFITTPSQWKSGDWFSSSEEGKVSWDDMISLPDYVFLFHLSGEPENAFYTVVEINDQDDFEKGLKQYGFEKTATGSFASSTSGIEFIQRGNSLLIGNAAVKDKKYIQSVASALFSKKDFIVLDSIEKLVKAGSHLAMETRFIKNSFFTGDYPVTGDFNDASFVFSTSLQTSNLPQLSTNSFRYSDSSLLSAGFTQPGTGAKMLLPDSAWTNISKAVNFDLDSFLLPSNHFYQLDITGLYSRADSAVSYTYDDDFNPVEKVVVNKVEEPAYNFIVYGDSVPLIYNYWNTAGKFETSGDSSLFTPVPFVKSYCTLKSKNQLLLTSANYKTQKLDKTIDCILFIKILLSKIPPALFNYLPPAVPKLLQNIETAEFVIEKKKGQTILNVRFNKKKNDQPLVSF